MKTIEELAREAGFGSMTRNNGVTALWDITGPGTVEPSLTRFAALVAEQCARAVEASYCEPEHEPDEEGALVQDGERAATASHAELIRAAFPMPKG